MYFFGREIYEKIGRTHTMGIRIHPPLREVGGCLHPPAPPAKAGQALKRGSGKKSTCWFILTNISASKASTL